MGVIDTGKDGKIIRKPVQIKDLSDIKSISTGVNYAMALQADGCIHLGITGIKHQRKGYIRLPK